MVIKRFHKAVARIRLRLLTRVSFVRGWDVGDVEDVGSVVDVDDNDGHWGDGELSLLTADWFVCGIIGALPEC